MVVDDVIGVLNVYSQRSLRLVARMVDMHLEIAQQEAVREQQRIISAVTFLAIGATLTMTGFILLQVFLVLWLYAQQQNWLTVATGLTAFDLLGGGLLVAIAVSRLRGPYMPNTVSQLTQTTAILLKDDSE